MKADIRRWALAGVAALALSLGAAPAVDAKTFKWANAGDVSSMDPYYRNETFLLAFLENIYEPLMRRDESLGLEPALAMKWGQISPTTWFFDLRSGVKFHDGSPFTAADVVFSLNRASSGGSNMKGYFTSVKAIRKVNDLRVEVDTAYPDPLLASKWAQILIMSKAWAEKNNATVAADATKNEETFATRNAMGTGPFMLKERRAGEKTILVPNPSWWDKPKHNLTEVIFTPVTNPATRVAALKAGDIDMMYEVPPQDTDNLKKDPNIKVIEGPETRIVYLGFDHERKELLESNIKGKNPFQDKRVREAFYRSIDVEAIKRTVMRGQSFPTALMVAPGINGYVKDLDKRPSLLKPEEAKKLLAEAGYPNGFEVGMDCPNDRYVNDEKICQAVVAMLARIGVKVNLLAQTRSKYFTKILRKADFGPGDTSFYMLGWSPAATYDVHNVFESLLQTPNKDTKKGSFNVSGYSNKKLDELADKMEGESDKAKRDAMIREATKLYTEDYAYIPLHQQAVIWAARKNITLHQPADNRFPLRFVQVK
ncbi:ABC transporter substrate-binding protein [Vineibacter terrae]|uniref:ABC transporter substrate-binding protein n=1 Tax=Vineibacter terrae TaxID=2586908 RepID=A0A5C8PP65_9HYPH|nr:ABC transporter substrate-binding protein [Vineibacter terrae]TXL76319.1 ABC transporter substrate-binding protein [Vineibacter terrae]